MRAAVVLSRPHFFLPLPRLRMSSKGTETCAFSDRPYRSNRLPGKNSAVHHDEPMYLYKTVSLVVSSRYLSWEVPPRRASWTMTSVTSSLMIRLPICSNLC